MATSRSTQIAQTHLAKVGHYPHIVRYGQYALMNVGPW